MRVSQRVRLLSYGVSLWAAACTSDGQELPAIPSISASSQDTVVAAVPKLPGEMMPAAPRVTCQGNQLSIAADNSTLAGVLNAVNACLGVEIKLPDGEGNERSWVQLGPGPAREILDAFLSSSGYDYAIQSSSASPDKILTVLLMERVKDGTGGIEFRDADDARGLTLTPARRAWLESRRIARLAGTSGSPEEPHVDSPEPASNPGERVTPAVADAAAASGGSDSAQPEKEEDRSVIGQGGTEAAGPAASATPATGDQSPEKPPANEFQNKITQMQSLFEQRKQLTLNQNAPANPN